MAHHIREWLPAASSKPAPVTGTVEGDDDGRTKHGLYTASARREHCVAHFQLKDPSDHLVAEGSGRSVSEAENASLEATTNDGAQSLSATSEISGIAGRLTY